MSRLIFVRHSQPEIVDSLPAREWRLSVEGKMKADGLAKKMNQYKPHVIVSSVEPKAIETAEIIAKHFEMSFSVLENLHEHERDHEVYRTRDEFEKKVSEFFAKPNELIFGDETADQACDRFNRAVHSVLQINPNRTVMIISHGTVIALFVSRLTGVSLFPFWKELGLPSFVVLDNLSRRLLVNEKLD